MSPFSRIPIWGAITVRVEGSQQNEDANMCLGHGIRVGWGKTSRRVRENQFIFPQKSEIMLELFCTSSQLSTAPSRWMNVKWKKKRGSRQNWRERKKKVTSTHKKRIYGCLKRFRLSINIFFITKREAFYSVNESRWGRTNCGEHKIDEVNLAVNAISRDSCYFWTLWTTRGFVANSIYLMRCRGDEVSS